MEATILYVCKPQSNPSVTDMLRAVYGANRHYFELTQLAIRSFAGWDRSSQAWFIYKAVGKSDRGHTVEAEVSGGM